MVKPANTKYLYQIYTMLDQRRKRWAGGVYMLYKCFVFAGFEAYRDLTWQTRDLDPMLF